MDLIQNYINGQIVPPRHGQYLDNYEPASGAPYGRVAASTAEDLDDAATAAQAAFPAWARLTAEDRAAFLNRIADGIAARLDEFAHAEARDAGKPLVRARTIEIPRAIQNFRYFAAAVQHAGSEFYATGAAAWNLVLRKPRGVAGLIAPWNLPLYLLSWKIAPALATGNTAIAKPSEITPVTAALLAEVCRAADLPPGVLNIVHGRGPEAGAALVAHPAVRTISFTGGTATGRTLAATVAPHFKKISLELGGKNPNIVFADAPPAALAASVAAAFSNTGQICLCGARILVERTIFPDFVEQFAARAAALRVGDPLDPQTEIGPLVSAAQLEKTMSYVKLAQEEGGMIRAGGAPPANLPRNCASGYFFQPTVFTGLDEKCRTNQEEIFGPVVTIQPFDDAPHAITLANSTAYGLSATVWTRSLDNAQRVADELEAGTVWVNCWLLRDLRVPFGGVKQSGLGREGGDEALRFFTEPKTVCIKLPDGG